MSDIIETLKLHFTYNPQDGLLRKATTGREVGGKKSDKSGYTYLQTKFQGKNYPVHRIITMMQLGRELDKGEVVKHVDGNGLDNRWENLKIISKRESVSSGKTGASGVDGVSWNTGMKKWQVRVTDKEGVRIVVGYYENLEDAKEARERKMSEILN